MIGARIGTRIGAKIGAAIGASADPIGGGQEFHIGGTGQSNMDWRADIDTITGHVWLHQQFTGARQTRYAAPSTADPPVFSTTGTGFIEPGAAASENMGVELTMMRRLAEVLPGTVYLHTASIAGSSYHAHRKTDATYPTAGPNAHALIKARFQAVAPRLDCLVDISGESDAGNATAAAAYEANITAAYASFRSTFGAGLPIVISQLADTHTYSHQATVIAAQATVAGAIGNCSLVSNTGRALNGADHYTNKSFADLGYDLADAVLTRLGYPRVRWTSAKTGTKQITFTYAGTGLTSGLTYLWNFGDGTTSTQQNPVKTYTTNGKYTVTCTATGPTGKSHTYSRPRVVVDHTGVCTVDATSGRARPASQAEENALVAATGILIGARNHLYQMQEASGNLADTGTGGKTLTQGNTPFYQRAIAGETTLFVGGTGDVGVTESFVNAAMTNVNAARVAAHSRANWNSSAVASNRAILNRGAAGIAEVTSNGATAKARAVYGSVSATSVNDHAGATRDHFIYQDPTAQRVIFASPLEVLELNFYRQTGTAYVQQSGAELRFTGQAVADVTVSNNHNFGGAWDGIGQSFADSLTTLTAAGPNYDEIRCWFEAQGIDCAW